MTISTFLDPALMPNQTMDQATFDSLWAQLLAKLPVWGEEANATEASMSAFAAGGAYAFPYIFDSATADADPGVGKLRLGSATQSAATVLRIDNAIVGGVDIAAVFTHLLAGTSATKGSIRLVKAGDPSKWMIFDVIGGSGSGYRNLVVSARAFSATSPFANADPLIAYIERTGDKGDAGPANFDVPLLHVREEYSAGTNAPSAGSGAARVLNTVVLNGITGASLASNRVTLPAGTYDVDANATVLNGTTHRIKIFNVTDNAVVAIGSSAYVGPNQYNDGIPSRAQGRFTIAAAKVFEVRHYGNSGGGGQSPNDGSNATYTEAIFRKVA